MKWAHLPLPGGIYDQHPELLDQWTVLFGLINEKAESDRREMERKSAHSKAKRR